MKKVTILLSLLLCTAVGLFAQSTEAPAIKVLPTLQKEVVKVLYAYDSERPVEVKFYNDEGVLIIDRIKGKDFANGFTRRYDLHRIKTKKFWVEVTSNDYSVTYKMTESPDGKRYLPFLEKAAYSQPLVAANN